MLKELNKDNFIHETTTGLKLIEFYATWCGYCAKQEKELLQMDKIYIGQVDVDSNEELVKRLSIRSFPTFLVFQNGREMEQFSGFRKKEELMNILIKYM